MTEAFVTTEAGLREATAAIEAAVHAGGSPTMITHGETASLARRLTEMLDVLLLLLGNVGVHPGPPRDQDLNDAARRILAAANSADVAAEAARWDKARFSAN